MSKASFTLREARPSDANAIVSLIRALAEYERQPENCHADPKLLEEHLFGEKRFAEVILAEMGGETVGFALFFHNYSTWLTRPGLYLEDLFVTPAHRGLGIGEALLTHLARLPASRGRGRWGCGKSPPRPRVRADGVERAHLERARDPFLPPARGGSDGRLAGLPARRRR